MKRLDKNILNKLRDMVLVHVTGLEWENFFREPLTICVPKNEVWGSWGYPTDGWGKRIDETIWLVTKDGQVWVGQYDDKKLDTLEEIFPGIEQNDLFGYKGGLPTTYQLGMNFLARLDDPYCGLDIEPADEPTVEEILADSFSSRTQALEAETKEDEPDARGLEIDRETRLFRYGVPVSGRRQRKSQNEQGDGDPGADNDFRPQSEEADGREGYDLP